MSVRYNLALVLGPSMMKSAKFLLNQPPAEGYQSPRCTDGEPTLTLKLSGEHFVDSSKAYFGSQLLTMRWLSPNSLEADVPAALLLWAVRYR